MITTTLLLQIMPDAGSAAERFATPLQITAEEYEINTPLRIAPWLAQIAHESGQLRWVREFASGDAYEGRQDLGNTHEGDGHRFRGRGIIQLTGRANYERFSAATGIDYVHNPEWLERPPDAARVSGWFWQTHGLNELADLGPQEFIRITRRINGGTNGLVARQQYHRIARVALGLV